MSKQITEQDVRHAAQLSRLHLSDDEIHDHAAKLESVLEHIARLNELDVESVEPLSHPLALTNVLREDRERPGMPVSEALANAPESAFEAYFRVPKVLGDAGGSA